MLEIKNLNVKKEEKELLKDISLTVKEGEGLVVFGPNGGGKSTLFKAISGVGGFKCTGNILLNGEEISKDSIDGRVKKGLGYMYQTPPVVKGVELSNLVKEIKKSEDVNELFDEVSEDLKQLDMGYLYDREINVGLSGGEIKRSELFTLSMLEDIKMYLFDEPDSGVDMENVKRLGEYMKEMVKGKSYMIVTHTGEILDILKPKKGVVLINGKVVYEGDADEILEEVRSNGYSKFSNTGI